MLETDRYTVPAIALHWMIFILVACAWSLGTYMSELPFSPQKLRYVSWHKWTGVTVFLIAGLRLMWRISHPVPAFPPMPAWQRRAATAVHAFLYALILVIPVTGWLFSSAAGVPTVYFGLLQVPDLIGKDKPTADVLRAVHATFNWTLLLVVIGHVAFALKHHFVDRDDVLARMFPLLRAPSRKKI